jgi:hypothetical protein
MDKEQTQNLINQSATNSQYTPSPTSIHFHNGNDAPKLPVSSLQTSIQLNGKPNGIVNPVVLNGRSVNNNTLGLPSQGTIYTLPVNVIYGGGAGTNADFPSGSTATQGTMVFFDTDNGDLGLWLYDLNGWFQIPVSANVSSINGNSSGSGVTSISSGLTTTLTPSNNFANGVTWNVAHEFVIITAGQYLVTAQVTYLSSVASVAYQLITTCTDFNDSAEAVSSSATGEYISVGTCNIHNFSVGDTIYLQTAQFSGSTQTVQTGQGQTFVSIAKV